MADLYERIILKLSVAGEGWAERVKQQLRQWAAAGMSEENIIEKLTADLSSGGATFEAMMKAFSNATGEAVDYVSIEQMHEDWEGEDKWTWITLNDENRCEDCAERDGKVATWDEWEAVGLPGTGTTRCGWRCRCDLVPG